MKQLLFFSILIAFSATAQTNDIFKIQNIELAKSPDGNRFDKYKNATEHFFEDEDYIVTSKCRGEFGGEVVFTNKHNKSVNVCDATCPLIINKVNNKYYLTTTLSHMGGFYGIYEITDPKELAFRANDTLHHYSADTRSGLKQIAGGMDKVILLSFIYKSQLYHIVSDLQIKETYVATTKNAGFIKVQSINKSYLFTYINEVVKTREGIYVSSIRKHENDIYNYGYIEVFENNIKIVMYK